MSFNRFAGRLAMPCFLGCLLLGLVAVWWRATSRTNVLKAAGKAEGLSQVAALESQLNQAVAAAQALSLLAKQNGGTVPNFSRAATDLLSVFPGLDSLEIEPAGIVSDVVPRVGHDRMIGFNVMNDLANRSWAQAAIQHRAPFVAGPLLLPGADLGIVARVPVFQRGHDNREAFWGFTAVSMRLSQAVGLARVAELPKCGFGYACYVPATAQQHAITITEYGNVPLQDALQLAVRIQNADVLHIALYPRGGWFNKAKFAFDLFAVLVVSGLLGLLVNALESRQAVEESLAEASQQVAREAAERQRKQEDSRTFKDAAAAAQCRQTELDQTRASLQQAQQTIADLQSRLQAVAQAEKDNAATVLVRLQQDQATIADLHAHLDAATRSARESAEAGAARVSELEAANQQLSARLAAAAHYEARVSELTSSLQQAEAESVRLREKLNELKHNGADAALETLDESPEAKAASAPAPDALPTEESVGTARASRAARKAKLASENSLAAGVSQVSAIEIVLRGPSSAEPVPAEMPQGNAEASPREKSAKPAKRKKTRGSDQMDLFGGGSSSGETSRPEVVAPAVEEPRPQTALLYDLDAAGEKAAPETAGTRTGPDVESTKLGSANSLPGTELDEYPAPVAETVIPQSEVAAAEPVAVVAAIADEEPAPQSAADAKAQAKALRRFVEEHFRAPEKIRDDLVQGDPAAAQETVQALKTAADEAGAREVHDAAAALLRAIHDQADPAATEFLWADLQKAFRELAGDAKPATKSRAAKPKPARPLPPPPPLDIAELRSAVGMIVPLLMDNDPGARDCLNDNRDTFRSTFPRKATWISPKR
jgi:hypothetical protein